MKEKLKVCLGLTFYCCILFVPTVHTAVTVPFSGRFMLNIMSFYGCALIAEGFNAGALDLAWYGNVANPNGAYAFYETAWPAYTTAARIFYFDSFMLATQLSFLNLLTMLGRVFVGALAVRVAEQGQVLGWLILLHNSYGLLADTNVVGALHEITALERTLGTWLGPLRAQFADGHEFLRFFSACEAHSASISGLLLDLVRQLDARGFPADHVLTTFVPDSELLGADAALRKRTASPELLVSELTRQGLIIGGAFPVLQKAAPGGFGHLGHNKPRFANYQ